MNCFRGEAVAGAGCALHTRKPRTSAASALPLPRARLGLLPDGACASPPVHGCVGCGGWSWGLLCPNAFGPASSATELGYRRRPAEGRTQGGGEAKGRRRWWRAVVFYDDCCSLSNAKPFMHMPAAASPLL